MFSDLDVHGKLSVILLENEDVWHCWQHQKDVNMNWMWPARLVAFILVNPVHCVDNLISLLQSLTEKDMLKVRDQDMDSR